MLALGLASWVVGWLLGWDEFLIVAAGCLVALGLGLLRTIGRSRLEVTLELEPQRLVVGDDAVGRVAVRNPSGQRTLPVPFEAPVGRGAARFQVPALARGATWDDVFIVSTSRRSVMTVGPVSAVRGDALGLARRAEALSDAVELYVHPRTVRLSGLTAGWIRDLEGRPTNDLSSSDVAFHTLREYVPGDDRRHIHWRTSARMGKFMVRQFVDSRRCHLGIVLSTSSGDYAGDDEFELAVSVVGSLARTTLLEDQTVTVTTGGRPLPSRHPTMVMDALAGVELADRKGDLGALAKRSVPLLRGASITVLVAGSVVSPPAMRAAAQRFQHDSRVLCVRVAPGGTTNVQTSGSIAVVEVTTLDDLARAVRSTVSR